MSHSVTAVSKGLDKIISQQTTHYGMLSMADMIADIYVAPLEKVVTLTQKNPETGMCNLKRKVEQIEAFACYSYY